MRTESEDQGEEVLHSKLPAPRAFLMNFRPAVVSALALAAVVTAHAAVTSRPQADAFARKIVTINQHAESGTRAARRTTVTETEVNSWFEFHGKPLLPVGVQNPKVTAIGNGKLLGNAIVDLEAIGKKRSTGTFDLWSLVGGKVPISVTGILHTKDGKGRFELQSAEISGLPLSPSLLQELVSYYSRTAEKPQGVKLNDPFELPAKIKQIEVGQAQAVVVQ